MSILQMRPFHPNDLHLEKATDYREARRRRRQRRRRRRKITLWLGSLRLKGSLCPLIPPPSPGRPQTRLKEGAPTHSLAKKEVHKIPAKIGVE